MKLYIIALLFACSTISAYSQKNISLIGQMSFGSYLNDVCSWVDSTGKEYAIVGLQNGVSIVDLSDPANPKELQRISGPQTYWRDIDTWKNYAYVTNEVSGGLMVIELYNLDTVNYTNVSYYTGSSLSTAHTIFIDENGYAYLFGSNISAGGVDVFDLNNPATINKVGDLHNFYIHDGYVRHDTLWAAAMNLGEFAVIDVTDHSAPVLLATSPTPYSNTHNTGLSDDNKYLFVTDEVNNSYITSFDISDLSNIKELDKIRSATGTQASAHNVYVNGNYLVASWYTDGVRIIDATYPSNLIEVGSYDTSPLGTNTFDGDWSTDHDLPSGLILASDIQQGLFILKPTYVQAAYLVGVISDASDSSTIYNATIEILSTTSTASSNLVGEYATGYADSGSYQVVFSKPGYYSDTLTVFLQNGIIDTLNVQLEPMTSFTVSGIVVDSLTQAPIYNANILIWNELFTYETTTDSSGQFQIASFFAGDYEVVAGTWGYVTECMSSQSFSATANSTSVELVEGLYDDFAFDYQWTISGTGTGVGQWERAQPFGTNFIGVFLNPDQDITNDCYGNAYVTGNQGVSYDDDDVDKNKTVKLISPIFDLTGYTTPFIHLYRWFFDMNEFGLGDDYMKVSITNGTTTVELNKFLATGEYSWKLIYYDIAKFITPTSTMQLTFEVKDLGDDHMLEAGIDQFQVLNYQLPDATSGFSNDDVNSSSKTLNAYPNPYKNECVIIYTPSRFENKEVYFQLFDISGKIMIENKYQSNDGVIILKNELPQGVYFAKIYNERIYSEVIKITKIE